MNPLPHSEEHFTEIFMHCFDFAEFSAPLKFKQIITILYKKAFTIIGL